jgi:hypothetical protein
MSGDDAKYTLSGSKLIVMMINVILQKVESSLSRNKNENIFMSFIKLLF